MSKGNCTLYRPKFRAFTLMESQSTRQDLDAHSPRSLYKNSLNSLAKLTILAVFLAAIGTPAHVEAGIFAKVADFFTGDAKAETIHNGQNSQTTPVLEAKMSPTLETKLEEDPVKMNSDDVLVPQMGALGTALDVEDYSESDEISVYITKSGDTLSQIASMYKVSVNTIVWANDGLDPKKPLKEGTSLLIMPISGVAHTVKKGDTLKSIAKKYNADALEIARFNGITDETLTTGESIMVPNGELAITKATTSAGSGQAATTKTVIKKATSTSSTRVTYSNGVGNGASKYIPGYDGPSQGSYYRRPVSCIISQMVHGKNGVDLACRLGTPVGSAATGTVIAAKMGYNGGYGNMIVVDHPNGTQTLYGHLSKISVSSGQSVSEGEVLGYTGNSGQSTGPHLHFEIRGAQNCMANNTCR